MYIYTNTETYTKTISIYHNNYLNTHIILVPN